ncbi:uncharacterized protein LOC132740332 isoform X2 [Ruditapes philippinarum]|uniref:uncharacterized protein LOC132740332 isoform X2 n=1 Tax=Ruditapes philippinarum TaxID=129788 RepID=UPI00295C1B94|nr:uncharacterized protein LOC132740332 isoform X2 [Ruditapes philippinarum]
MTKKGKLTVRRIGERKQPYIFCVAVYVAFCSIEAIAAPNDFPRCFNGTAMVTIDKSKQICCNGIYDKTDKHGVQQSCCGLQERNQSITHVVFSTNEKICCGGKLIDLSKSRLPNSTAPTCCGQDYFYSDKHICCNNKIYNKAEKACSKYDCGEVVYGRDEVCCGYYTSGGYCANVHRRRDGYKCCGPYLINRATHKCFKRQPRPKGELTGECGSDLFDQSKFICCEGREKETYELMPKPSPNETIVKYIGITPDYSCLGDQVIDNDIEHITESGNSKHVVPNNFLPCGNSIYDPHNKRTQSECCEGVVNHAHPNMNVMCCGKEFIDLNKHVCCNNKKIESSMLCCGGNQIYSRYSGLECCGTQLINNSYICCNIQSSRYVPVRKEPGHNKCCGWKTYNSHSNKVCCAGKIIETEQNQTCISGHIVTLDSTNPKQVKEIVKSLAKTNQQLREIKGHACPSCATFMKPPKKCVKKFENVLYIRDVAINGNNTIFDVLFLDPSVLRGAKMKLFTKGHCGCLQEDKLYMFQTNRNILAKLKAGKNKLRFSKKDICYIIKGGLQVYKKLGQRCKIDRYLRKPVGS